MPDNYERLLRNISLNGLGGQITAINAGLSSATRSAHMSIRNAGNSGSAQNRDHQNEQVTRIRLETLDGLWPDLAGVDGRCDFIKIDVEGHEVDTLQGARGVLETHRPVILLEVDPPRLSECGSSREELQGYFEPLGYRFIVTKRNALVPVWLAHVGELRNVICLHPRHYAEEIARWS